MKAQVVEIIKDAVTEYGEQTQNQLLINADAKVTLYGPGSPIDSIGLVTIIVATEQRVEETFGKSITLADEKAMSQKNSPFRSIESLAEYITELLGEEGNG